MLEGAPKYTSKEAIVDMAFKSNTEAEQFNNDLIKQLVAHHQEAFLDNPYTGTGMDPEQKEEYLNFVARTAEKSDNPNERKAAEIFLKQVKGERYEN